MNIRRCMSGLGAAALSIAVLGVPAAIAAQGPAQGDTSGPASGKMVTPGAAVQKQASHPDAAAGAPGVEAKQGTEGGSAPAASKTESQTKVHQ